MQGYTRPHSPGRTLKTSLAHAGPGFEAMDEPQPFGLVLKRLRRAAGLTHGALAERAGLGARTISDLERGVSRAPRADTLALLVQALDLTAEQRSLLEASARQSRFSWNQEPEAP